MSATGPLSLRLRSNHAPQRIGEMCHGRSSGAPRWHPKEGQVYLRPTTVKLHPPLPPLGVEYCPEGTAMAIPEQDRIDTTVSLELGLFEGTGDH